MTIGKLALFTTLGIIAGCANNPDYSDRGHDQEQPKVSSLICKATGNPKKPTEKTYKDGLSKCTGKKWEEIPDKGKWTVLSVIFDGNDSPIGVGGGDPVDPTLQNDKNVSKDAKICFVATDSNGEYKDVDFDILFSPEQKLSEPKKTYKKVKFAAGLVEGLEFKYTIVVADEDNTGKCTFLDPRFVIN